ncbi:MAG: TetR/AcrR family transcriptional regulator [Actinomycetota bacterium]|nr:TetR/AcrR family transcriptional regulator [Actinomycetota bacterium]MDQ2957171.1 TetR/AcrR family transcriptional regulator [Actinomycetota bacterium]
MSIREQIIEAARCQLAAHGFASMTIRQVAREVEVDPGTVRHYFPSKDRLAQAAASTELDMTDGYDLIRSELDASASAGSGVVAAAHRYLPYDDVTRAAVAVCLTGGSYDSTVFRNFDRDIVRPATEQTVFGHVEERTALIMSTLLGVHVLEALAPGIGQRLLDGRADEAIATAIDGYLGRR